MLYSYGGFFVDDPNSEKTWLTRAKALQTVIRFSRETHCRYVVAK